MARPLRLEFPGALYHVTSRGDRREDIYLDDTDRVRFLDLFVEVCERYNWRCHAYCLMTNHYHLVTETPEGNLSAGMRQLNGVYTQRFNRRHDRVGHVFQGRYTAILVEKDNYLFELARYVVLNPVRANMVQRVEEWPWSSYRATAGNVDAPPWLEVDGLLGRFSGSRREARRRYVQFVHDGSGQSSVWGALRRGLYLGDEAFVNRCLRQVDPGDDLTEVPRAQRRPKAEPLRSFVRPFTDHRLAMAEAFATGGYTMKEIAAYFGVHYSTVSRAVRQRRGA